MMKKAVLEIIFGALLLAVGVLIILFLKDFTPRFIGGAIISLFGAVLLTSGVLGCVKK